MSRSLAGGWHFQNVYDTQTWCVRKFIRNPAVAVRTETPACQSVVRCIDAQVAQIPQLRGLIEVERQIDHFYTQKLFALDRSEEEVAQLQARCNEFWCHPEHTQDTRDEGYLPRAGVDANGR